MKYIFANWKQHFLHSQTIQNFNLLMQELDDLLLDSSLVVGVAVSHESIGLISSFKRARSLWVGSQSCSPFLKGSYTGEVSAASLQDAGSQFVFIGHSERRKHMNESDGQIADQVACALSVGLQVVLCIGESEEQRESGNSLFFLEEQIKSALQKVSCSDYAGKILIAYEPEYAVGTGVLPSVQDIKDTIAGLQNLKNKASLKLREAPLLYGGSISEKNYELVAKIPYIEGFLIGKASLDIHHLKKIVAGRKVIKEKYVSYINKNYKRAEKI